MRTNQFYIEGTLHEVGPIVEISKVFEKKEIVIKYAVDDRLQTPPITFKNENIAMLDDLQDYIGKQVRALCHIEGKERVRGGESTYYAMVVGTDITIL
jgi:hypothetical protein